MAVDDDEWGLSASLVILAISGVAVTVKKRNEFVSQ